MDPVDRSETEGPTPPDPLAAPVAAGVVAAGLEVAGTLDEAAAPAGA